MGTDTHLIENTICPACGMEIADPVQVRVQVGADRDQTLNACCDECAELINESPAQSLDAATRNVGVELR